MAWKVFCSVYGEDCNAHGWHTNGLEFDTKEEADAWGADLFGRWTMLKEYESREVATEEVPA